MQYASCTFIQPKPQVPRNVSMVRNYFKLTLDEKDQFQDQLKDGVRVTIESERSFWLTHYWGTKTPAFHSAVQRSWSQIKQQISSQEFLENESFCSSKPERFETKELSTTLKPPIELTSEMLGSVPRAVYPLVILITLDECASGESIKGEQQKDQPDDVVSLLSVVHIRDSICPASTNIISQLAKLRGGGVLCLQTLYTPGITTPSDQDQPRSCCVICQDLPISRALLPCRHACVCGECYDLIDKCPLCRGFINSFFEMDDPSKEMSGTTNPPPQAAQIKANSGNLSQDEQETSTRRRFVSRITNFLRPSSRT